MFQGYSDDNQEVKLFSWFGINVSIYLWLSISNLQGVFPNQFLLLVLLCLAF